MPKGILHKKYTGEFKQMVVETMRKEGLSYRESARNFKIADHKQVAKWERIYLEEGPEGLRGRSSKGGADRQSSLNRRLKSISLPKYKGFELRMRT